LIVNYISEDFVDKINSEIRYVIILSGAVVAVIYGNWIYNYLCNKNATFNKWRSVLLVEETGGPGKNNRPVGSH
jgi:hypothetical protein